MNNWTLPGPEQQLVFLRTIQRLFDEGEFVATYKFALLIALTELAIERGDESGAPLAVSVTAIAEKFIELYWGQAIPYSSGQMGTCADVLVQNRGKQAAVISIVSRLRGAQSSLAQTKKSPGWPRALAAIEKLVKVMPLWKLQTMRRQTIPFLYEQKIVDRHVLLLPGVAFCLRHSHGMIQHLARSAWVLHIRSNPRNSAIIGQSPDLESFMFGLDRAGLSRVHDLLIDLQARRCFYCNAKLTHHGQIDHFVPWSRYPRDLAHNFVLAHASCNRDKADLLASSTHAAKWRARNDRDGVLIDRELGSAGFVSDLTATVQVARWAYRQAYLAGSQAWVAVGNTVALDREYEHALA